MNSPSPFSTLPSELIHQILHRLDVKEILCSFRYVCSRFYRITGEYNNYKICITSLTPAVDIRHLCKVIRPENIRSIFLRRTTNDVSRIFLFVSLISVNRLTRLSSLHIHNIGQKYFKDLLPHLRAVATLTHLSVDSLCLGSLSDSAKSDLKVLIGKTSLQELTIDEYEQAMLSLFDSQSWSFHTLRIARCTQGEIYRLLLRLPQVRKFSSGCLEMVSAPLEPNQKIFHSLVDLDLKIPNFLNDDIELFLKGFPSLIELQLDIYMCEFTFIEHLSLKWERFIGQYLKSLEQFRFRLRCSAMDYRRVQDVEKVLDRFRSPFWFGLLGSSVTCKCINDSDCFDFLIYSHDDSKVNFPDNLPDSALSYTTSIIPNDHRNDSICHWDARIGLTKLENEIGTHEMAEPTDILFHQIDRLALDIDWPIHNFNGLSTLFHLSQLHEIWLFLSTNHFFEATSLTSLLQLAYNVQVIGLSYDDDTTMIPIEMLSILDTRIDHLKLKTNDVDSMIWTLSNIERLSIVTIQPSSYTLSSIWKDIIEWLSTRHRKFSLSVDHRMLQVFSR